MIEQTDTSRKRLDGLRYLSRDIEKNPEIFDRRGLYRASIKMLSSFYRASRSNIFQGGKAI